MGQGVAQLEERERSRFEHTYHSYIGVVSQAGLAKDRKVSSF